MTSSTSTLPTPGEPLQAIEQRRPNIRPWIVRGLCTLGLSAAVILVFASTLQFEFLDYDDDTYVTQNVHIQTDDLLHVLRWAVSSDYAANWHPLTWLSHAFDWRWFADNPRGHHAINVVLHVAVCVLLYFLLETTTARPVASLLAAGWFALHPLRVENVAWIAQRKTLLAAMFGVACLLAYTAYVHRGGGWKRYLLVVLLFAISLTAKPTLVTLPFALLLLDLWPLGRFHIQDWRTLRDAWTDAGTVVAEKIPMLALSAASCVATLKAQRAGGALAPLEGLSFGARFANACVAYVTYVWRTIWPRQLTFANPLGEGPPSIAMTVYSLAVLSLLSLVAILCLRRRPYLFVGWFWMLGSLVPMVGLVQVGLQATANRYTYWPHVGVALALAGGLAEFARRGKRQPTIVFGFVALFVVGLAVAARLELNHWRNTLRLTDRALALDPTNYIAHQVRGWALVQDSKLDLARDHYQQAIELRPGFAEGRVQLAAVLLEKGRHGDAVKQCEAALAIRPEMAAAHQVLGIALAEKGQSQAAIDAFQRALQWGRDDRIIASAHSGLGYLYWQLQRWSLAEYHCRRALAAWPGLTSAHLNLCLVLASRGEFAEAAIELDRAITKAPSSRSVQMAQQANDASGFRSPELLRCLAWAYDQTGNDAQAMQIWERAILLAESTGQPALADSLRQEMQASSGR